MFLFTILTCWYFLGLIGIVLLFYVDPHWTSIKRHHIFWCIVIWAWLGLLMWAIAGVIAVLIAIDNFDSSYWDKPIYRKKK